MIPKDAWPFFAAISAAFIAGTVSFVVTVLSKEQKTSEFRQAWIDSLREDLSTFASLIVVLHDFIKNRLRAGDKRDGVIEGALAQGGLADFKAIEVARLRILFRLNPDEHSELIQKLDRLYLHSIDDELKEPGVVDKLISDFSEEAQRVLKSEWKRVKAGEPIFRVTKWGALMMVIAIALAALYYMLPRLTSA